MNLVLAAILSDVLAQLSSNPTHLGYLRQQLRGMFGEEVIDMCDKYNRLPVFMSKKADYTPIQSENQLQMLVTLAEDYNILQIRLADRLHTLRTLPSSTLPEPEQRKLAEEALNVYAPLAHRMGSGMMMVKGELEDLALGILNPAMYDITNQQQLRAIKAQQDAEKRIKNILNNDHYLKSQGATFEFDYRLVHLVDSPSYHTLSTHLFTPPSQLILQSTQSERQIPIVPQNGTQKPIHESST